MHLFLSLPSLSSSVLPLAANGQLFTVKASGWEVFRHRKWPNADRKALLALRQMFISPHEPLSWICCKVITQPCPSPLLTFSQCDQEDPRASDPRRRRTQDPPLPAASRDQSPAVERAADVAVGRAILAAGQSFSWSPSRHQDFPQRVRTAVVTLLRIYCLRESSLGLLPRDIFYHLLREVASSF